MDTLTLKIPDVTKTKLDAYAKHKGVSKSQVVREALVDYFAENKSDKQGSFFDLAKDLAGSVQGPADLSSGRHHLTGYGK